MNENFDYDKTQNTITLRRGAGQVMNERERTAYLYIFLFLNSKIFVATTNTRKYHENLLFILIIIFIYDDNI